MVVVCNPDADNYKVYFYFFSSSDVSSTPFLTPGPSQFFSGNIISQDQGNLALHCDEVPLFQEIKVNEDLSCSLEKNVTVVDEGIFTAIDPNVLRENSIIVLERAFTPAANNVTSERFWIEMHDLQVQWIQLILTSSLNRRIVTLYTLACWKVLMKVFSMFRKRPKGFDESIQFYIIDSIKFLELLTLRGYREVSNLLTKFVITVIGRYLKKPGRMNEMSQTWTQSREMLRIVCQTPTNFDAVLEIIVAVDEMKLEFLKVMTCDREERNVEFICYATEQINDLVIRATQRLQQCRQGVRSTPPF
ncbi:unnamed protein product [Angiostrongylus costaricensis]|uniref:NR LBD domain-containing protein n=1 Tax=Angiostrongylus costaricensis TaxID=334426 RepID=A0A158PGL6_ANGCS|nr:unnamed protein product [Angiostrongylus costaricensis]